ncbi:hypothetical protein, partial [Klebsiella pneumoniae]|uniref:hypothetical protein n=1 Tax=Klebsiella pneumoniae TaxID=573 RepID=UPI001C6F9B87
AEQEGQQTETEATGAPQKHHYTLNQQVGSITLFSCDNAKTRDKKKLTLITIKILWFGEKFYLMGGFKIHLFQKVNFLYFS